MGLFSKPKCPQCGQPVTPTHYAFPFPQWRCKSCIERDKETKALEERITQLENLIKNKIQ